MNALAIPLTEAFDAVAALQKLHVKPHVDTSSRKLMWLAPLAVIWMLGVLACA